MTLDFQDFQKQDIKFDINELQKAYKEILAIKGFSGVEQSLVVRQIQEC